MKIKQTRKKYRRQHIELQFFKNVLMRQAIHGWRLNWVPDSSEGYCWKKKKRIDIGTKVKNKRQLILHEIAHIRTCRFCNQKHNFSFWRTFDDLMIRFLPNEKISKNQELHRSFASNGINALCYY